MTSTNKSVRAPEPRQRRWLPGSVSGLVVLTAVAPVAIALLSLALSVYTIIQASREPEIWLSAPVVVRLAVKAAGTDGVGSPEQAVFYVQPRLVSAARNERIGVITDLRLEVRGPGGTAPVLFMWREQGEWRYDPVGPTNTYYYLADPAPLVVGPSSPQQPTCLFEGPPNWQWQPGPYQVTIIAIRGEDASPLRTAFTMKVPADQVAFIQANPRGYVRIDTHAATPIPS